MLLGGYSGRDPSFPVVALSCFCSYQSRACRCWARWHLWPLSALPGFLTLFLSPEAMALSGVHCPTPRWMTPRSTHCGHSHRSRCTHLGGAVHVDPSVPLPQCPLPGSRVGVATPLWPSCFSLPQGCPQVSVRWLWLTWAHGQGWLPAGPHTHGVLCLLPAFRAPKS